MPDAAAYRRRAATLIELASTVTDPDLRGQLIDVALLFERLADFATDQNAGEAAASDDRFVDREES